MTHESHATMGPRVPQCQIRDQPTFFAHMAGDHFMKTKSKKTIVKGVKGVAKPARAKVETWDRVDNNLDLASKHMGYKRTKGQKRDIKGRRSQVARVS